MQAPQVEGLNELLGMTIVHAEAGRVDVDMPVSAACMQPFGYVHGGATLTLLEAAGSWGAIQLCDLDRELPFGVHMDVRHRKSCQSGTVHGSAQLESQQDLGERGSRQVWRVVATDDEGDIMSEGTFATRIVSREYAQQRNEEREG